MSEWTETTLGSVADITIGRTPSRKEPRYWTTDLKYPFCTIADMAGRSVNPRREGITQHAIADGKAKLFPAGSLMMSFKLSIGRVGFAAKDLYPNEAIARLAVKVDDLDERFLALSLESQDLMQGAGRAVKGSTLNRASLRAIRVVYPSRREQCRIIDLVASLDAQIEALTEEVARADRLWWSLGAAMIEALADAQSVRLDAIADISGGLTKNKKDFDQPDLVEVPYLRVANVHRRYLDLRVIATIQTTAAKAEALRLLPGDVLFNEGGDKDKLGRGDVWRGQVDGCIHQNHVFRARVTDAGFAPRFVSAWGNTFGKTWFETFGTQTTGIASINKRTLSRFPIPNVERAVQSRWADLLGDAVSTHDAGQAELVRLRAFRSSLLTALLARDVEIPGSYDKLLEAAS